MKHTNQLGAVALAAIMAAATPMAAVAQAEVAPMVQQVTDAEIAAFAKAYTQVIAINEEYVPQVEEAADDEARQVLLDEARVAQSQAVEATQGIDLERYLEILTLAQNDPDLTAQITSYLEG